MNKQKKYDGYGAIFLDIDGVICTERAGYMTNPHNVWRNFDPIAVGMVKNLCDEYKLKLVASSTWREYGDGIMNLKKLLSTHGIPETYFFGKGRWKTCRSEGRAKEIEIWLSENPNITRWIILDDINFFADTKLEKRLIQTHPRDGISSEDYINARNKLLGMK